jgi:hypothetical protein
MGAVTLLSIALAATSISVLCLLWQASGLRESKGVLSAQLDQLHTKLKDANHRIETLESETKQLIFKKLESIRPRPMSGAELRRMSERVNITEPEPTQAERLVNHG